MNELWLASKNISKLETSDIYDIYDQKTGHYTFITPLLTGAMLAGCAESEYAKLERIGLYLGRAFQIRDDIIGVFGDEKISGKPSLSDLKESKRTLLLLLAFRNSTGHGRKLIELMLGKKNGRSKRPSSHEGDNAKAGAVDLANSKIESLLSKSFKLIESLKMKPGNKDMLSAQIGEIFG